MSPRRLRTSLVLRVRKDDCDVLDAGRVSTVKFAPPFPTPRVERVSPGHLVAVATAPDGAEAVVWRWYDAVIVGDAPDGVLLWEPAHGEVVARLRDPAMPVQLGSRVYASAGLPGADWWVAGPVPADPARADVELDAVDALYTDAGLWSAVFEP